MPKLQGVQNCLRIKFKGGGIKLLSQNTTRRLDKRIRFEDDEAVSRLSGKAVTLEMKLLDCDVYSIKFE